MVSLLPVRFLTPQRLLWASIAVAVITIVLAPWLHRMTQDSQQAEPEAEVASEVA